ncbi:hypothetical protein Sya03_24280 [Spirilliplanes yamanashiensis]|uniref:Uncharacterized protein n=1 Tax=Spirilliplanes yamanashiensis TaxID=42233 RepID=A0A8J3Y723_9ACTN|nr:hypothetical protein Sya03_24280 [Spirilliplanes yamanashiensis]
MRAAGGLGVALLLTTLVGVIAAPAAQADGTVVQGNKKCSELFPGVANLREVKVEPPASGTYGDGTLSVKVTVHPLATDVTDHPGDQTGNEVFDFAATGGVVLGVAVKGGPDTNLYSHPAGTSAGTNLHAPLNAKNGKFPDLSHISFCYVPKAKPKIKTQVSKAELTIGGPVTDTATLWEGNNPTGTITFSVYGPNDATCAGAAVFTDTVTVNGNAGYTSDPFTPDAVGTYRWIAVYGGDARNEPAAGKCNDANEQVVVKKAVPDLKTVPYVYPNDTATLKGLYKPSGGTVVFKLYGNKTCTGDPIYTESQTVGADGDFSTKNTTVKVSTDGTVSWIVTYSGDDRNEGAVSACGDEQVTLDFTPLGS